MDVKILPKAVVKSDDGVKFDVDVYIPEFSISIEYKVFEDPFAPMTQSRLDSVVGRIMWQIRNYFKIGIKRVIIVINLTLLWVRLMPSIHLFIAGSIHHPQIT